MNSVEKKGFIFTWTISLTSFLLLCMIGLSSSPIKGTYAAAIGVTRTYNCPDNFSECTTDNCECVSYIFYGKQQCEDAGGNNYTPGANNGAGTCTAPYENITIKIKLDNDNPSTFSCTTSSKNDTDCSKSLPTLSESGKVFLGWTETEGSCDSPKTGSYTLTTTTKASTLYPCWANASDCSCSKGELKAGEDGYYCLVTGTEKVSGWDCNDGTANSDGGVIYECTSKNAISCSINNEINTSGTVPDIDSGLDSSLGVEITFDPNGGTLSGNATKECEITSNAGNDTCVISSLPTATRSGYTFNGWGTSKSCTSGSMKYITVSKNDTYYACWVKNGDTTKTTLTASFRANYGTISGDVTKSCSYTSGSSCTITDLPTATRSGYTFNGWGTTKSCTSGKTTSITLTEDDNFYACWVEVDDGNNDEDNNDDDGNVDENPQTGEIAIFIVWSIALMAICYSVWYFKGIKES